MPPSTLNVRNGSPTIASTAASQIQIVVATTRPSRVPSPNELCCFMIWCSFSERGGGTDCRRRRLSAERGYSSGRGHPRLIPEPSLASDMTPTGVRPAQETRPRSLVFQLLGTAQSVTVRLAEALGELGLSPAGLDLLTRLAQAREPLRLDNDVRELVVMLERDGLVRTVTNDATRPRVTITLTALGATRQRAGAERLAAAYRQLAPAPDHLDRPRLGRAPSALR